MSIASLISLAWAHSIITASLLLLVVRLLAVMCNNEAPNVLIATSISFLQQSIGYTSIPFLAFQALHYGLCPIFHTPLQSVVEIWFTLLKNFIPNMERLSD